MLRYGSWTQIIVKSPTTKFETTANENGEYELELPVGNYRISARKMPAFIPYKRDSVRIETDKTRILNIQLKIMLKDAICVLYVTSSPIKKGEKVRKTSNKN
jgi:hypothetical protein